MSTILLHLLKRIPLQVPSDTTTINTAAIREHIKNADKANKQGKEKTISLREQFLTEQAKALAARGSQSESSARLPLMNHERMQAAHKHLRHLIKPLQQSPGLCRIMIPALPTPPTAPTTADPVACFTCGGEGRRLLEEVTDTPNLRHLVQPEEFTAPFGGGELTGSGKAKQVAKTIIECFEKLSQNHPCLGSTVDMTLTVTL
jgi:hypothetical protein